MFPGVGVESQVTSLQKKKCNTDGLEMICIGPRKIQTSKPRQSDNDRVKTLHISKFHHARTHICDNFC